MKTKFKAKYITTIISILAVIAVLVLLMTADVRVSLEGNSIIIRAISANEEIAITDVESVTYLEEIPVSSRVFGYGTTRISSGVFQSETYGKILRATHNTVPNCILVLDKSGNYYLFNLSDADGTGFLYNRIAELVNV